MQLDVNLDKKLGDFSFTAQFSVTGQRIGVFGPSGSGKSTLGNLLTGFLSADNGRIELDGHCLFDSRRRTNLSPDKRRVAVVFQHAHLFPHLDVRRNLLYGQRRTPTKRRTLDLDAVAAALEITPLLERSVNQLSGGEKQRVALGRALLACPDLLILDEPLSALDRRLKEQIIPFLDRSLRRFEIPYLYVSHSLAEMRLLTDQVLHFGGGRLQVLTDAESLALERLGQDRDGYINHLQLSDPREVGSLLGYRWGRNELLLKVQEKPESGYFALSSKDILLFRKHPQALSARNLIPGTVTELMTHRGGVAVKLDCQGENLIAEVVREAAAELELTAGRTIYLAIKASAFRRLM
ncbi:MAG: molybdenum ABC transporter ATP-binding protein [Desulfuromonas sp.]|nr:MAG: molybdenum ABC transporter ATP-binding protein [Desulfuromonas sp.]